MNIFRAGFLESGVSRIVDQVVEQKIDSIQTKVEEILYTYLEIEKPKREEMKNGALAEVDTALMPIDLEQVSDKTSLDSLDMKEDKEEIEEEIIDDDDFESPAFEPVVISESKMENTQNSNLSAISGLTSQDSAENNSGKNDQVASDGGKIEEPKAQTGLSQNSTVTQDNIQLTERSIGTALIVSGISGEEAQMAPSLNDSMEIDDKPKDVNMPTPPIDAQKSQFDLNKDVIEFTGTERKNISLDDSTNSGESEKALQRQDIPKTAMDIDRLYENDTTDSSEMKMEIDLKDESTQETGNSSRVENETSSRESLREKNRKDSSHEVNQLSHRSSRNHQSSSSSKFRHEKSKSSHKSSSHKKSSSEKEKSSSSRRDREKDAKADAPSKSRSKNESDDHHQEKNSRRRRSTDHDSRDGKDGNLKQSSKTEKLEKDENRKTKSEQQDKSKSNEVSNKNDKNQEQKSSILEKHDYIKSPQKSSKRSSSQDSKNKDDFHGFVEEKMEPPKNPWFDVMDLIKNEKLPKFPSTKKARTKNIKPVDVNGGKHFAL